MQKKPSIAVVALTLTIIAVGMTALPAGAAHPQDRNTTPFEPLGEAGPSDLSTPEWATPSNKLPEASHSATASGTIGSTQTSAATTPPELNWSNRIGNSDRYEQFESVKPTNDGGYVMAGIEDTEDSEYTNPYIVKTDGDGTVEWTYEIDDQWYQGIDVSQVDSGEYMVSYTNYNTDSGEIYGKITQLSADGNPIAEIRPSDNTQSIIQSSHATENGVVITGSKRTTEGNSAGWLAKVNADGETEFSQTYNLYQDTRSYSVDVTANGYAIAGDYYPEDGESTNPWMARINEDGTLSSGYKSEREADERFISIDATSDGGFILGGDYSGELFGPSLTKIDSDLSEEWKEVYFTNTDDTQFYMSSVDETADGYGAMGYTGTDSGGFNTAIFHADRDGQIEWVEQYGNSEIDDGAFAGQFIGSNSYILAGTIGDAGADSERFDGYAIKVGDAGAGGGDDGGDGGGDDGGDDGGDSSGKTVGLSPATVSTSADSTVTTDVVVENVSGGVGAYDFDLSVNDTTVATIESIELAGEPGTETVDISADGSSATVEAALADTADTGNVSISSVTFSTASEGSAAVTLTVNALGDEAGQTYEVGTVEDGIIKVGGELPAVVGDSPPTDPDGDGEYEDINGDGNANVVDVQALFSNLDSDAVQNNPDAFDFNDDGSVNVVDVQALFQET